ncbi:hypothetical protein [Aequorivita xiaoshiensis]|uniref:Cytochrome C and Quinol oxidase polypeptide I n=1 Tax=Aequorivita xiaoshiensis TaxID=2874476 RepID=A0A9X1U6E5_9FLAO|nr:hypothetical protein [Aequorivita xiaoshiensis]MCG2431518.1 hypothetical protein [Aequorivita xiaoshiensis]
MINLKKHISVALAYFLLVALMGVLLRLFFVTPVQLNFKYILHAHSHTALLGWIYLGLTTLIYKIFLSEADKSKLYKRIFIFTNTCILGMLVTFPYQGYALYSIIFSTLFLFASYWFTWFAIKNIPEHFKHRFSWKLVKASLWYLVFSSVGPWAIGGVMATLGTESIWYKTSIYFYLHFQYNGWFILALLGILFYILEKNGVVFRREQLRSFFFLLNFAVIFTLFLSVLWFGPPTIIYVLGLIGAVAQILAFYELYILLKKPWSFLIKSISPRGLLLFKIAGVLLVAKVLMQFFSAFPYMADLAYRLKDFVIGYLHLVFLGIVVPLMLAFLNYFRLLTIPKSFLWFFLLAFITTEALIFYKAFAFWLGLPFFQNYYILLAAFSCLFPIAVGILFYNQIKNFYLST